MSESAFGIRLELLKMAKEIIEHDYFTKRDMENQIWNTKADVARSKGEDIPSFTFTPYPSLDEIMKKAKELNRFISERQ